MRRHPLRTPFAVATLVGALAVPAAGQEQPRFALEGWLWQGKLEASARISDGELGTVFDFKEDLGLADEDIPEGRLIWATGPRSRLRLGFLQVGYSGDATVTRTVEFGGQTYTVGTRVLTGLDKQYARLGWVWQFVQAAGGTFRFGTVLELKALAIDATLRAPELEEPISESESLDGILPTLGLAIDIVPHRSIDIFIEASGLDAGDRGSMIDAEAGVRYFPLANLGLLASYRILDLRLDDDPDYAKLRIEGPFVGLSLRF